MKLVELFAGIGGFGLGFEWAGFDTILQCEINTQCQKLLADKFPKAKHHPDVTTILHEKKTRRILERADVICGGVPCQDLSVAGQRKGLAGQRSGLWFAFRDIVEAARPSWVVIENVPGLLSSNGGGDISTVLDGLAQLGYRWAYRVLDAQYFGLAQRRARVFIVASLGDYRCAEVLFERESLCGDSTPRQETGQRVAPTVEGRAGRSGETNFATSGGLAVTAKPLGGHHPRTDLDNETYVLAHGQANAECVRDGSPTLTCNHESPIVAHAISAGRDGYNDGSDQTYVAVGHINLSNQGSGGNCSGYTMEHPRPTLNCNSDSSGAIAFTERTRADGRNFEAQSDLAYALTNPGSGGGTHSRQIAAGSAVRRLTPTECERLQGFPDGWTAGFSDSVRYRMLGNAVPPPMVEWIANRLKSANA